MKRLYILIGLSLLQAQAEPINRANFRIDIAATNEEIVIDGEATVIVGVPPPSVLDDAPPERPESKLYVLSSITVNSGIGDIRSKNKFIYEYLNCLIYQK